MMVDKGGEIKAFCFLITVMFIEGLVVSLIIALG